MRLKRHSGVVLMVLSLLVGVGVATNANQSVAHAKAKRTLKVYPKRIRGTWYSYQYHKMYRYKISAKKMVGTGLKNQLHSRKANYFVKNNAKMKHPNWVVARIFKLSNNERWVNVMGWYQTAGDGSSYWKTTHKLGGHKRAVLKMAGGAGFWTYAHGYHSKHLAKKYANHYFKGERRQP